MPETGFERRIRFTPAFDRRNPDPSKNYGIHGMEMRFVLIGPKGATQFVIYTGWMLRAVQEELDNRPVYRDRPHSMCHPQPADLGYHAYVPQYDGQQPIGDHCNLLGGSCYYDGSGLAAQDLYWRFVAEGEEAVWSTLRERHNELTAPVATEVV